MATNEVKKSDDIICGCTGTTKEKVKQLVLAGITDVSDISSKTGATTGCGSCDVNIVDLIKQYKKD